MPALDDVGEFYETIRARDADRLADIVDRLFAEDAVMHVPASLSYGGTFAGRDAIRRALLGLLRVRQPIVDPEGISIVRLSSADGDVVAELSFPWRPPGRAEAIPMTAVEWLSFADGRVREMKVYYWDTAACAEAVAAAATS